MKKRFAFLFLFIMLSGFCFVTHSYAANSKHMEHKDVVQLQSLTNQIEEAMKDGKTKIVVEEGIDPQVANILPKYCPYIDIDYVECFVRGDTIYLEYNEEKEQKDINSMIKKVNDEIDLIFERINEKETIVEKAGVLHDTVIENCVYNEEAEKYLIKYSEDEDNDADKIYHKYKYSNSVLLHHTGICQGYTYAYMYLMNRAGIDTYFIISDDGSHMWNVVKIGDKYYNVDCTWDDPVPDFYDIVRHKYFLCSDKAFKTVRVTKGKPHPQWDTSIFNCYDTTYDNYFFVNVTSTIIVDSNHDEYYINDKGLCKRTVNMTNAKEISDIGTETLIDELGNWYFWGTRSFDTTKFSSLLQYEDLIIYNTPTEIKAYNFREDNKYILEKPDTTNGYIYGLYHDDNNAPGIDLKYVEKKKPSDQNMFVPLHTPLNIRARYNCCFQCESEVNKYKRATKTSDGYTGDIICSNCKKVLSEGRVIPRLKTIKLSATKYVYNGKEKKPDIYIYDRKGTEIMGSHYKRFYMTGRIEVGKYFAFGDFDRSNLYSGESERAYFVINPKNTTLSSVKAASKGFKVNWKMYRTQTTGYQIQYSTSSKFTSATTKKVTKNTTTSLAVKKLKAKKKYYIRIRTYKTVSGSNYYSSWSAAKTVTTKK